MADSGKAVLVTGSSGHLGEALVRSLRQRGERVTGLDIRPSNHTDVVGSIADPECVARCMEDAKLVFHAATLHKPHVVTHSKQDFVVTNLSGTLTLLQAAVEAGVRDFVFTSTTSVFGDAMRPPAGTPAAWVTEAVRPVPRNIYGVTKAAAENLCHLFYREYGLNCIILRTSRFFPEEDDDPLRRRNYEDANIKANEYLYRRVEIGDCVDAHLAAADRAEALGFGCYIISATSPFTKEHLADLNSDAPALVRRLFPDCEAIYRERGWGMFDAIDRVYVNRAAREALGWHPKYDFAHVLELLADGTGPTSDLALAIGSKGYHDERFEGGPYPV